MEPESESELAPDSALAAASALWPVDRSRVKAGHHCQRERFWEYHSYNGYGIRKVGEAVPLATGIYVHEALAGVLEICQRQGYTEVPHPADWAAEVQAVLGKVISKYDQVVKARGFTDDILSGQVQATLQEQQALVIGLLWGWIRTTLPWVLAEFNIIAIEQEYTYVIGCSCGLGNGVGEVSDHVLRDCLGMMKMTRPDVILERKSDGQLGYHEFKTAAQVGYSWEQEWKDNIQFALGALGAERIIGREVSHYYIHALIKGSRVKKDQDDSSSPRIQNSGLVYRWYRPGVPPVRKPEWKALGGRWPGKDWDKIPIPQDEVADWAYSGLDEEAVSKMFRIFGPYDRPTWLIGQVIEQIEANEESWREKLDHYWGEAQDEIDRTGEPLPPAENVSLLNRIFIPSWDCYKYGSKCQFFDLCHQVGGMWMDPVGSGQYAPRRPHHTPEVAQMIARGVEVPVEVGDDDAGGDV